MWILRLVRNLALLAVLALAAHAAAGADKRLGHHHCGAVACNLFNPCKGGCTCDALFGVCLPKHP